MPVDAHPDSEQQPAGSAQKNRRVSDPGLSIEQPKVRKGLQVAGSFRAYVPPEGIVLLVLFALLGITAYEPKIGVGLVGGSAITPLVRRLLK